MNIPILSNTVPFTGSRLYDSAIAVIFFFFGVWALVRYGKGWGWIIIIFTAIWAYQLFSVFF